MPFGERPKLVEYSGSCKDFCFSEMQTRRAEKKEDITADKYKRERDILKAKLDEIDNVFKQNPQLAKVFNAKRDEMINREIEQMKKALKESDEVLNANPRLKTAITEIESRLLEKSGANLSGAESVKARFRARNSAIKFNPALKAEYIKARDEFKKGGISAKQSIVKPPDKPKKHGR